MGGEWEGQGSGVEVYSATGLAVGGWQLLFHLIQCQIKLENIDVLRFG